jgi:glutathione S-transferase
VKAIRLITIPMSHYCEKARWALEWAGVQYIEEQHLQGFHVLPAYLAARRDTVPILVTEEGVFPDSTEILKWCDQRAGDSRKLYPAEPGLRREVELFEDALDEEFGVASRLWMYSHALDHLPLLLDISKAHRIPRHELRLMPWVFPIVKGWISGGLGISPVAARNALGVVNRVFEKIGETLSDGRPYLFGERFTAADLTFASLSAAVLVPENYGVRLPQVADLPPEMRREVERLRGTPAGTFALRLFAQNRHQNQ